MGRFGFPKSIKNRIFHPSWKRFLLLFCAKMNVVNAKKLIRLGAFSEQKWVWAWVLKFNVFQRPSWSLQKSIWTAFLVSKWGPKTVLQSVFFRVPTSRHDY